MVTMYPRSAWTRSGPIRPLTPLDPAQVRGVAVHWPGAAGAQWGQAPTLAQSAARLEAERVQHTTPSKSDPSKPWSDIAYSQACDLAGRLFDLRGIGYRSAANGNQTTNSQYLAITILMGERDTLTPSAVDAVRAFRQQVLSRYPHATQVVGHRDLYSTECPGPQAYALVRSGAFASSLASTPEAPVSWNPADLEQLADYLAAHPGFLGAVSQRVWAHPFPAPTAEHPDHTEMAADRLVWAARQSAITPTLDTILGAVRTLASPDELAAAIASRMPAGSVDPKALAAAVRAEFTAHPLT